MNAPDTILTSMKKDGSRLMIHPADVRGKWIRIRRAAFVALIGFYVLAPFIPVGGHPMIQLDIEHRRFYLFGQTFNSQDVWLVLLLTLTFVFGLLLLTAWRGRVWCGWACPQTVFIEQVFRRIERLIEGDAQERRKLDKSPWTPEKIAKRGTKLFIFFLIAFVIAHVFISYFVSIRGLYAMMLESPLENWSLFLFVFAMTGALLFDFVWFREQFCIVMCPYGRLQSVLIDNDSVVIGYDKTRGEPRGKTKTPGAGDCIDCHRCVAVCPTGIDIRQGLQIECIGCSNCVDACDAIMDKVGRPRGLVRYDSINGFDGKKTRIIRPRIILYTLLLVLGASVMSLSLLTFKPATVTMVRMTGSPYYLMEDGVRNQYLLRIFNKQTHPVTFTLRVSRGPENLKTNGLEEPVEVAPLGERKVMLVAVMPKGKYTGPFQFDVETRGEKFTDNRTIPFLGPTEPR
jgi:cytochrome c oxidase accessory protein FixG